MQGAVIPAEAISCQKKYDIPRELKGLVDQLNDVGYGAGVVQEDVTVYATVRDVRIYIPVPWGLGCTSDG